MKLLEIVRADKTADDVIMTCMDLAKTINKVAALVGVCPGFVGNRILFARQAQAQKLVYKGCMPWDVDAALNTFGFRMGPYQMSDMAGSGYWLEEGRGDRVIRSVMHCASWIGADRKPARAIMTMTRTAKPSPSDVTAKIIREVTGVEPGAAPSQDEIIDMCIHPMINEALKILEEGMAQRASDVDVVWLNGYGWPADKGGPMLYGDMVGADKVLATMERLGADDDRFMPADTLAQAGQGWRTIY